MHKEIILNNYDNLDIDHPDKMISTFQICYYTKEENTVKSDFLLMKKNCLPNMEQL